MHKYVYLCAILILSTRQFWAIMTLLACVLCTIL